ncbi:MAG: MATE family efflux transporter [Firmicutes bacterium]|nr:MATE family efflux transporter [Bacillota bacterium]
MEKSQKLTDMTSGNALGHIIRFAIPLLIGSVFQQLYNFVDTMIAGRGLGDQAIAAIGATSALYSLLFSFANGLNNGYGLVLARLFGAKDRDRFRQATAAMILLDTVITSALTLAALLLLRPLLFLLDTPADIFDQSYRYIAIILGGLLTTIFYNMCAALLRAVGNSRIPLYFLILSCVINLGLDLLLILVFRMGTGGLAAATVIAQGISALCCWVYIVRNYPEYLPKRKDYRPARRLIPEMLSSGLSMALMLSVFAIGSIIMQRSVNQLGTLVITANTASRKIIQVMTMPLSMLATANATFAGQNYGAKRMDRVDSAIKKVILLELAWSAAALVIVAVAGEAMILLLTGTASRQVVEDALLNLRLSTVVFFPLGVLFVLRMAMQSMNRKIVPVISSSIELLMKVASCIFAVPVLGYLGVALTEPLVWVVCAVFLCVLYAAGKKRPAQS